MKRDGESASATVGEGASILDGVVGPEALKRLSIKELEQLAGEIRQYIIDVMAVNGGHLASNLGAIELTVALHYVFSSPLDRFIWDVSHQTYAHKLVTGRKERFPTIRKQGGLCGFSDPTESPHDHFFAGHAGTALSLGLGVARARDLLGGTHHVIPIIGDATLTCGMSLEALNNLSRDLERFIIILNDNAMSISENVGAITQILSRILSNPTTHKLHQEIDNLVARIPLYGRSLIQQGHKITGSLKNLVSPAAFFEQYGLTYLGPFDGHNLSGLIDAFTRLRDSPSPLLLHLLTEKGHGMEAAIANPVCYHGAKPFCRETGRFLPVGASAPSYPKVFGDAVVQEGVENEQLVVITPAMAEGSYLNGFKERLPKRFFDVGIAEGHAVTFAGGLAKGKQLNVVVSIYGTFLQRALDNLFHDVCLQELPVIFAIDRGGLSPADGPTHHGIYDIAFLRAMPNMVIAQPRNGRLLRELLSAAFSWGAPVAIRYPNQSTVDGEKATHRELGRGEMVVMGGELLLLPLGHMAGVALELREKIKERYAISATVFDPIFIKPLDRTTLLMLLSTHSKVVTIEEHSISGGLGAALDEFLMEEQLSGQVDHLSCGIDDHFLPHGSYSSLLEEAGLTCNQLMEAIAKRFCLVEEEQQVACNRWHSSGEESPSCPIEQAMAPIKL